MTSKAAIEESVPVVGFVGPSGVGKTTLLERLIRALTSQGLAVAAVKHASHGFLADRPGKDSYRLYESGASAVTLISREQTATFARTAPEADTDVSLARALATLPRGLHLVLAEGFSWEPIPRVVLFHRDQDPTREHVECGEVIERVCVPSPRPGKPPEYSEALIESLARLLVAHVARTEGASTLARDLKPPAADVYRRPPQ